MTMPTDSACAAPHPIVLRMAAALKPIWPPISGQNFLEDSGLRAAVLFARGFTVDEIREFGALAFERERQRRKDSP